MVDLILPLYVSSHVRSLKCTKYLYRFRCKVTKIIYIKCGCHKFVKVLSCTVQVGHYVNEKS